MNQRHVMDKSHVLPKGWPGVPEQGLAIIRMVTGTGTIYSTGWKPARGIRNLDMGRRRHDTRWVRQSDIKRQLISSLERRAANNRRFRVRPATTPYHDNLVLNPNANPHLRLQLICRMDTRFGALSKETKSPSRSPARMCLLTG